MNNPWKNVLLKFHWFKFHFIFWCLVIACPFVSLFRLVGALQKFSFSGFTCLDLVSVESVGGCCCGWVWVWSVFGLGFYDLCFVFSWCFLCLGLAWVSDRIVFFPLGDFFSSFGVWFFGGFGNFSCWALDFVAMSGFSVLV